MKRVNERTNPRRDGERGSILVMTTLAMATLLLFVGLSVDVAHVFMVRTQLQYAADAAALTAVRELDSTAGGIEDAADRAVAMTNTYEYRKYSVTVPRANVTFSASRDSGYMSEAAAKGVGVPETIKFVRVTTQAAPVSILFVSSVLGSTRNETATATAGMSIGLNKVCDYFPLAVTIDTPLKDLTLYQSFKFYYVDFSGGTATLNNNATYAVMNPGNGSSGGSGGVPVVQDGLSANDSACVSIDTPVYFSTVINNGNKDKIAQAVNKRFTGGTADTNTTATNYVDYVASGTGNDRRVLLIPVVNSGTFSSASTNLEQFAGFFIKHSVEDKCNGKNASPDCAAIEVEFIGNIVIPSGSYIPGGGASSNLSIPVLY